MGGENELPGLVQPCHVWARDQSRVETPGIDEKESFFWSFLLRHFLFFRKDF